MISVGNYLLCGRSMPHAFCPYKHNCGSYCCFHYNLLYQRIVVPYVVPRRRQWDPTPVLLPGKSHGQRSLVGCSPWDLEESDTTERRHFHFSLSCIGEGNDNPLQCSCLENPRDGGAWWAAVYGVAQSWTRLERFSSSSSFLLNFILFIWLHWVLVVACKISLHHARSFIALH